MLDEHPAVGKSVVIAREDDRGGKRLIAYVVQLGQPELTASNLREYLHARLPDYMIPSSFVTLDALPLTRNGKVDRAALRAREDVEFSGTTEYVAPRTPVEETLAKIWSEVLGVPRVGVNDNFFELGGHSLLATRLLSRARQAFQTNLPLNKLFETPTIAAFAAVVESVKGNGSATRVPVIKRLARTPQRVES